MNMSRRVITQNEAEDLSYSEEYAEYVMEHSAGDRIIGNGDALLAAMEDCYLWDDFLDSMGLTEDRADYEP